MNWALDCDILENEDDEDTEDIGGQTEMDIEGILDICFVLVFAYICFVLVFCPWLNSGQDRSNKNIQFLREWGCLRTAQCAVMCWCGCQGTEIRGEEGGHSPLIGDCDSIVMLWAPRLQTAESSSESSDRAGAGARESDNVC